MKTKRIGLKREVDAGFAAFLARRGQKIMPVREHVKAAVRAAIAQKTRTQTL